MNHSAFSQWTWPIKCFRLLFFWVCVLKWRKMLFMTQVKAKWILLTPQKSIRVFDWVSENAKLRHENCVVPYKWYNMEKRSSISRNIKYNSQNLCSLFPMQWISLKNRFCIRVIVFTDSIMVGVWFYTNLRSLFIPSGYTAPSVISLIVAFRSLSNGYIQFHQESVVSILQFQYYVPIWRFRNEMNFLGIFKLILRFDK